MYVKFAPPIPIRCAACGFTWHYLRIRVPHDCRRSRGSRWALVFGSGTEFTLRCVALDLAPRPRFVCRPCAVHCSCAVLIMCHASLLFCRDEYLSRVVCGSLAVRRHCLQVRASVFCAQRHALGSHFYAHVVRLFQLPEPEYFDLEFRLPDGRQVCLALPRDPSRAIVQYPYVE